MGFRIWTLRHGQSAIRNPQSAIDWPCVARQFAVYYQWMYRRPKFLEVLLDIRREMAHDVDYDTDLFAEMIRTGRHTPVTASHSLAYEEDEKQPRSNGRAKSKIGS